MIGVLASVVAGLVVVLLTVRRLRRRRPAGLRLPVEVLPDSGARWRRAPWDRLAGRP